MIILATYKDERSGTLCVSHGVDYDTLKNVCLPCEPLNYFIKNCGAVRMNDISEWVLFDKDERREDFDRKVDQGHHIRVLYRD